MTGHPPLEDLVDRSEEPDIVAHLSDCPSCRARWRLYTSDPPGEIPGLEAARSAMAQARQNISQQMSWSLGIGPYDEPDDLEVGQIVERYAVEERVGRGGMGTVYRVRHVQLDSLHALKLLHRTSRSVRDRLVREGRAQSKLRHPNVVPVTDIVDVDGAPGLVMEFVDGPTLAKHLAREGRPDLDEADRLGAEIIRGVAAAHEAGVVHRDLKPGNVMLLPTGEGLVAKVTDFGLARELSGADDSDLTKPQTPLGTPAYMAPEQIHDASRADERSDIFSLGAVLYELVTGEQAFTGPDVVSIYDRVRAGEYTPPRERMPEIPERMATTIERALAIDPTARFADCRELLSEWRGGVLANSLSDSPTTSTHTVQTQRPWSRWALPLAAIAAVAATGVAAATLLWPRPPAPVPPAAPPPPEAPVALAAALPQAEGVTERRLTAQSDDLQIYAVATAPDGESFTYADGRGIWRQPIDGGTASLLLAGGAYHNLGYFPDGNRIFTSGYVDDQMGAWTLAIDGSDVQQVSDTTGHIVRLSPDGRRLAFTTDTGIWLSDVDGQNRTRVRSISPSDSTLGLAWSPTGQSVASVHVPATGDLPWLEISRIDGSATRRIAEHRGLAALSIAPIAWVAPDTLVYASSEQDGEDIVATVYALDDAETAPDGSTARAIHAWTGFFVLRLEPSADGQRFVTSRATANGKTGLLDVDNPGELRAPSGEDWMERPVMWIGPDELLVASERGGGGLYVYDLGSGAVRLQRPMSHGLLYADLDGDNMRMVRSDNKAEGAPIIVERMPRSGGAVEHVQTLAGMSDQKSHRSLSCKAGVCLMSEATSEGVEFSWFDLDTGEASEPVAQIPLTAKWMRWDLSPDATELAIATSNPPRLTVRNLSTTANVEWPAQIDFPQAVSWRPDGSGVFVSGLVDSSQHPYRIVSVDREGASETLWTSMSQNVYTIQPSPDGKTLALGIHAFDDDVWLVEGLLK